MTVEPMDLRIAAMEAVRLLDGETSTASQQARQVLLDAFSTALPPAAREALDSDPGVQAALQRIAADQETYYLAAPNGGPSDAVFTRSDDERSVDDAAVL